MDYLNVAAPPKRERGQDDDTGKGANYWKKQRTPGKGKGKGKSKNKGGKGTYTTNNNSNSHEDLLAVARKLGVQLTGRTPDNKYICYRFNDGQDCDGRCQMLHICRIKGCHEKHPMIKHKGWAEAAAALNQ